MKRPLLEPVLADTLTAWSSSKATAALDVSSTTFSAVLIISVEVPAPTISSVIQLMVLPNSLGLCLLRNSLRSALGASAFIASTPSAFTTSSSGPS